MIKVKPTAIRRVFATAVLGIGIAGYARFTAKAIVPDQTFVMLEFRSLFDSGLQSFIETNIGHALSRW